MLPDDRPSAAALTVITYHGQLMGKEYRLRDNRVVSETDGNASLGSYAVRDIADLADLNTTLATLSLEQIIVHGVPKWSDPDARQGHIHSGTPASYVDPTETYAIQRTKEDLTEPAKAVGTLDSDFDSAPAEWTQHIQTPEQLHGFLVGVVPELKGVGMLIRPSGSNGITNPDGTPYRSTRNFHTHFFCNGAERAEIIERLHGLFVLSGYAWIMIGESGSLLNRSAADLALRTPNQPVFAAAPRVVAPVTSQRPEPLIVEGTRLTLDKLPPADPDAVAAKFAELKAEPGLLSRQATIKAAYRKKNARAVLPPTATRKQMKTALKHERVQERFREKAVEGVSLPPDFVIYTMTQGAVTVREINANLARWDGVLTRDPIEPGYRGGTQTGKLYTKGRSPVLVSLAHGIASKYHLQIETPFDIDQLLAPKRKDVGERPRVPLSEGAQLLRSAITQFHMNEGKVAVRMTPGGGKTYAAMRLVAYDHDNRYLVVAPLTDVCRGQFLDYLEHRGDPDEAVVFLGRSQPNPDNPSEQMCVNPKHVAKKLAFGSGNISLCTGCPLRRKGECGYDRQLTHVSKSQPRVVFASHHFTHLPLPDWEPDRVVIDEAVNGFGVDLEQFTNDLNVTMLEHFKGEMLVQRAEKLLRQHFETLPNYTDLENVKAHRHKSIVLEAIIAGEEPIWLGGKTILPKRVTYRYKHLPTLILDGTFRRWLFEQYVGPIDTVHNIDIHRNWNMTQIISRNPKHKFGDAWLKRNESAQEAVLLMATESDVFFTTKTNRALLGKLKDDKFVHLGGSTGSNKHKDAKTGIAVLHGQPPMTAMIAMAEVLTGGPVDGREVEEVRYIRTVEGLMVATTVFGHTNQAVTELLRHHREDQIEQQLDRMRASRADQEAPKILQFYCPVALDMPVNAVVLFEDAWPTDAERAFKRALTTGSGILPEFGSAAHKVRPDVFKSDATGKKYYREMRETGWESGLERMKIQEKDGLQKEIWGRRLKGGGLNPYFLNKTNALQRI